jgi:arginyl-tRNA synthetase
MPAFCLESFEGATSFTHGELDSNVMDTLEQIVSSLSLGKTSPSSGAANALIYPLDVCRAHLTKLLVDIVNCSEDDAEKSIQWPNNIFSGDLAVILPKLRPGVKADQLAMEIMEKVCRKWDEAHHEYD